MAARSGTASFATAAARPPQDEDQLMSTPPLVDRIALVTGASRGIGRATALALARAGAHVVAVARTVGGLEELDDAIGAIGGSATLVPLDLKDTPGMVRLAPALEAPHGRVHLLVGNARIPGPLSALHHLETKAPCDPLGGQLPPQSPVN